MAIEIIGVSSGSVQGGVSHQKAVGTANGDVILMAAFAGNAEPIPDVAGWTTRGQFGSGGNLVKIFYRVVTSVASDPATYAGPGSTHGSIAIVFRGVDTSAPFSNAVDATASDTATLGWISTTDDSSLLIALSFGVSHTAATGMALVHNERPYFYHTVFSQSQPVAGSTGIKTISPAIAPYGRAILTALRPAGDSPPPPTAKPWTRAFIVE